jgi:hypothetical protein
MVMSDGVMRCEVCEHPYDNHVAMRASSFFCKDWGNACNFEPNTYRLE